MANACVDPTDFQLDGGGRLQLQPHYLRSATENFTHTLVGASGIMEEIGEIAPLVIPVSGVWVVAWDVHGNVNNTPAGVGTAVATNVFAALARNDVIVIGTETAVGINSQGAAVTAEPGLQLHMTGSGTDVLDLVANDQISLYAARASDAGTTTQVLSGPTGRTRIRAWRLGPS